MQEASVGSCREATLWNDEKSFPKSTLENVCKGALGDECAQTRQLKTKKKKGGEETEKGKVVWMCHVRPVCASRSSAAASPASQLRTSAEQSLLAAVPLNGFQMYRWQCNHSQFPLRGISQKPEGKVCPLPSPPRLPWVPWVSVWGGRRGWGGTSQRKLGALPSSPNGKISWLKDTKRFPLVFSLLIKIHKMVLKRKIIVLPTHDDTVSYQHTHRPIPSGGRGAAMHAARSNSGRGRARRRRADRDRAVLRLWSWVRAKSYCTATPEPQHQTGLWPQRAPQDTQPVTGTVTIQGTPTST